MILIRRDRLNILMGILIGIISLLIVRSATQDYMIHIAIDSSHYHIMAYNLSEGKGLLSYNGEYPTVWPPLYPMVLALLHSVTQLDVITVAYGLNLLIAFLIGTITFLFLASSLSLPFALIGAGFVIFAPSLNTFIMTYLLTEPLFILICLLQIIALTAYLKDERLRYLALAGLLASLAVMTRYIGIINMALIVVCLLIHFRHHLKKGLILIVIMCGLSSVPFILWMARNYTIDQTFLGARAPSVSDLLFNIRMWFRTIQRWFFHADYPQLNDMIAIMACLIMMIFLYRARKEKTDKTSSFATISIVFCFSYSVFLILSATRYHYDLIDFRLLSPIYIPLVLAGIYIYHQVFVFLRTHQQRIFRLLAYSIPAVLILTLIPLMAATATAIIKNPVPTAERGGLNALQIKNSPVVAQLREIIEEITAEEESVITIYTNQEGILGVHLVDYAVDEKIRVLRIPRANLLNFYHDPNDALMLAQSWSTATTQNILVHFHSPPYELTEKLQQLALFTHYIDLEDGSIYYTHHANQE